MTQEVVRIGGFVVELWIGAAGAALIGLLLLALVGIAISVARRRRREDEARAAYAAARTSEADALKAQLSALEGGLKAMGEMAVSRQSELTRSVNERLDRITQRVGDNLNDSAKRTTESLGKLNERLAVIDRAQKNLTELSGNVVTLQHILANKQARGAFGQMRMEQIIQDGLPRGAYTFQATLSNGKRPDCLVRLPDQSASIVIDAKFPLEGFEAYRTARADADKALAGKRVRYDVGKHVEDIATRYLIPGETQDTAILFVPSEAIYADLHEHFEDLVQKAYRAPIVLSSPNMLMLMVQTVQAVLKDVQMRQQAGMIQKEVACLMADMTRLRDRVLDLQSHFGKANDDIGKILTSSDKITSRGRKIEMLEFEAEAAAPSAREAARGRVRIVDSRTDPAQATLLTRDLASAKSP